MLKRERESEEKRGEREKTGETRWLWEKKRCWSEGKGGKMMDARDVREKARKKTVRNKRQVMLDIKKRKEKEGRQNP